MNVNEFYGEIGRHLNDPNNSRWTTAVLLARMNRSAAKILVLTNSVKTQETLTATAATQAVQIDTDAIDVIRVDIQRTNGDWKKLPGIFRDQLDFQFPNWQQLTDGEPLIYWWDGTNQQINLVPAPDSANAITDGLKVWEIQKPSNMTDIADVPFDSNAAMIPYHDAIVYDVTAECWMDDGTPEALSKARFFRSGSMSRPGEFESAIMRITSKFDAPEDIPARILYRPTGGRISQGRRFSKGNPLGM